MNFIWVFLGGGAGACTRYAISKWLPFDGHGFPWATAMANFLSCILLGLLAGYLVKNPDARIQLLGVTGFCGGFSTFSTFSAESLTLMQNGHYITAATYIIASLISCLLALWIGMKIF